MARTPTKKGRIGSSFSAFLEETGRREEAELHAIKRVIAWQIESEMQCQGISKAHMAARMKTSRSQLDRFLDPANDHILLETMQRAAFAVGKRITFIVEDTP